MSTGAVIAAGDARKTVLVVDDAPSNIRVVNEILHKSYQVRVATNGAKALELAKAAPGPDLILLDVVMPGMDGYEVCARLKADAATKDIPVIFLTGQTEIEDIAEVSREARRELEARHAARAAAAASAANTASVATEP